MRRDGRSTIALGLASFVLVCGVGLAGEESAESRPQLLPNQVRVSDEILAGGQPSLGQLEAIRDAGYRSIVDLRTEAENGPGREEVEALGMAFYRLPIAGEAGLSAENARRFATLLEEAETPLVVHCASGNRVGALFALKAFYVDGLDADAALEVGRKAGLTSLEENVRHHLERARAAGS